MTLRVSGKNLDIGDSLRTYIQERINATLSKYRAGPAIGHVTIEPEGPGFRADCTLHLSSGATVQVEGEAQDPYASFNVAADRVERRVRRFRQRLTDRRGAPTSEGQGARAMGSADVAAVTIVTVPEPEADVAPARGSVAIIAEPSSRFKEMTVSGAVAELDVTNAPLVVFRHACDGRTNVVYRRPDGHIGWIDPARA